MMIMFNVSFILCLAALIVAFTGLLNRRNIVWRIGITLNIISVAALTAYFITRWMEAGRPPFSNMFESLVLFAWTIMVVNIVMSIKIRQQFVSAASALMVVLALAYATTFGHEIRPLVPALQSNWLTVHVFSCFLGYGGFAVSFVASISYLVVSMSSSNASDDTRESLETVLSKTLAFGFLFLTVGIITGAVWANSAWGTYWSWDPKETWSLVTWLIYAGFLHSRFIKGWRGRKSAWLSIVGFISVLFTYFGVNFLMSGLHSYL